MKVLLVNGSPRQHGCTHTALTEAANALNERGVETEIVWVGNKEIAGCTACGSCRKTGKCIFDDIVNEISDKLDTYDGFIFGTPVYYGGPSGQILSVMNRLFYSSAAKMAGKPVSAVVSCRRGGASAAFQQMNMHFMMTNMIVITSQYWNQVHGNTPEEVRQDAEGLQTMRTLAENMTFVLRSIEAGKAAGVPGPNYEPKERTNFIR
ncbi:MAG: flavodoxin family protein [Oscillospiraceae bacterium]|nr:flavodoxin family protein [Oscillospiraceae bacterium]